VKDSYLLWLKKFGTTSLMRRSLSWIFHALPCGCADKVEEAKVRRRVASTKDYVTNNLLTIHDMI
jgi:hypothetical protein